MALKITEMSMREGNLVSKNLNFLPKFDYPFIRLGVLITNLYISNFHRKISSKKFQNNFRQKMNFAPKWEFVCIKLGFFQKLHKFRFPLKCLHKIRFNR